MTNLTDKWEKGELPNGWYWVEGSREEGIYAYTSEYLNTMYRPRNGERIIEQVPSFEQWQELKSKLQLKETAYNFDTACLEEEKTKLKELLKWCAKGFSKVRSANLIYPIELDKLRDEIDRVLGEE